MKRKLLALAVLAICAAIVASSTLAYFTAEDTAHNVITSGRVDVEIVETQRDEETGTEVPYPTEPVSGVMPGGAVSKIVTVKNTGDAPAWVRMWINVGISEPGDPISNPLIKNLPLTITGEDGSEIDVVTFALNETYWTLSEEDGYYYHNEPVEAGKATAPLFKEVRFAKEMGNEYQNCKVLIDVSAEAIQWDNNNDGTAMDAFYDDNSDPIEILPLEDWFTVEETPDEEIEEGEGNE